MYGSRFYNTLDGWYVNQAYFRFGILPRGTGQQHSHPIEAWGGKDALCDLQERDRRKARLCRDLGITLIAIDYTEPLTAEHIQTRAYAYLVIVETSCVSKIRPSWAAHASTAGSAAHERPASCTRTMSRSGRRRNSPRTMSLLRFSSASSRSIAGRLFLRTTG